MKTSNILFQNNDFIVVNKPAGLNFHSEDGEAGVVVLTAELLQVEQLYSVHRLDKMTSGLLLLAKTKEAAQMFTALFEERKIEKFYLAISRRKPKKKQGWIKGDMKLSRRGSYMLLNTNENPAITQFHSTALEVGERLFLVKPHSGKTHQIRVALKSIGSPIAGDERYAQADEAKKEQRGYLHAFALRFTFKEKIFSFTCNPDFGSRYLSSICKEKLLDYAQPWTLFSK